MNDAYERPKLLISVRDAEEARAAIAGGCDILDVKEPAHGSLGMAEVTTIGAIAAAGTAGLPLSAALGETTDWIEAPPDLKLPAELDYVKLGTAGLANRKHGIDDWRAARRYFDAANDDRLKWIAVAYADWDRAAAPKPGEMLQAATESSCAGLLVDTFVKDGRGLLEWMPVGALADLGDLARRAGLLFAVAGSLRAQDVPAVRQCRPDIIAVRSAACSGGVRSGAVTLDATRALCAMLAGGGSS